MCTGLLKLLVLLLFMLSNWNCYIIPEHVLSCFQFVTARGRIVDLKSMGKDLKDFFFVSSENDETRDLLLILLRLRSGYSKLSQHDTLVLQTHLMMHFEDK